jgi:general stress protein YciG
LSLRYNYYVTTFCTMSNDNRGLASADEKTKKRVASEGGSAPHDERGLEATDQETRERVAREGGKASHGGGRKSD